MTTRVDMSLNKILKLMFYYFCMKIYAVGREISAPDFAHTWSQD